MELRCPERAIPPVQSDVQADDRPDRWAPHENHRSQAVMGGRQGEPSIAAIRPFGTGIVL